MTPGTAPAGSKYGTSAYDPAALGQEMAEPRGWARLKTLTLVSLGIHVVSSVAGFATTNEDMIREVTVAQLESQGVAATEEMIDQAVGMGMAFNIATVIVTLVVGLALYLLVYFGLRKRQNWARILGTVLAAVGALFTAVSLFGTGAVMSVAPVLGTATLILGVAFVVVNVWWIITAFSGEVNAYLRARAGR